MPKEDEMQRTLVAEFPGLFAQFDTGTDTWQIPQTYGAWEILSNGVFVAQQDIDLSGYAMDRKTFYPYTSFEQRGGVTSGSFSSSLTQQPYVVDITICSSVPLTNADLIGSYLNAPGFIQPSGWQGEMRFNRDVILHGELKWYTIDSNMAVSGGQNNLLKLLQRETFSSLEPTAADKLYCYRLILISANSREGLAVTTPPTRVLMPGNIASEPKVEYMMRLKRSYELANQL